MTLYPGLIESEIVVDGAVVRVYDSGGDWQTPTIVLVHGTGSTAEKNYWALFPMLAFEHRVVAMDLALPGDGSELTLDFYVRQLEAVLEQVRDQRGVTLVGYSLGAVVSLALAARRSDLLTSIVTIAGWMKTDRHQILRNNLWRKLQDEGSSAKADFALFASYSAPYVSSRTVSDYEEIVRRVAGTDYPAPIMNLNRTIDIVAETHSIALPALVIGCIHDVMVQPRHSREIFGAIKDARYAEIQAGHAVVHERPAELFALIDRFVADPDEHPAGTVFKQTDA
ncbi:alpha/beta fold hydrolase [Microbacterium aerolatum]|uniref:alpha/beta fold hydrolase n=1 Tax=Microbacterium aerolatum TaxID=153731 RepID=UPI00384F9E4B